MAVNDNDRILRLRNEASLYLDDLVALVINSSLALELRLFSEEIMEMKPGFAFSLKQARSLRDESKKTLKQYQASPISDGEMMSRLADARSILKNDEIENGGNLMGFFDRLAHGKKLKQQETIRDLEKRQESICKQIEDCENDMTRRVDACVGLDPNSTAYRNNMHAYNTARDKLKLLRQQETQCRTLISDANRKEMMEDHLEQQKALANMAGTALGSEKERDRTVAELEIITDKLDNVIDSAKAYGNEAFARAEKAAARTSSDFDAKVAARERHKATVEMAGERLSERETAPEANLSEFERKVRERSQKDNQE